MTEAAALCTCGNPRSHHDLSGTGPCLNCPCTHYVPRPGPVTANTDAPGDTLLINAIREVLTVLDEETGSRQYALETIEKIISDAPGLVIAVEVRDVYGMEKVYPADPTARLLADLAGTR